MTPTQISRLEAYVRRVADLMGLRDWRVFVSDKLPDDETAMATIYATYGRRDAAIRFRADFAAYPAAERRYTVVHELVHCHLEAAWTIAEESMPRAAHAPFRIAAEYATDAIATAIAPHMPLP